jgi:hypothetical protein
MPETLEELMAEFAHDTTAPAPPPILAPPAPPSPRSSQQQVEQAAIERSQRDGATAEDQHQRNLRALSATVQQFKRAPELASRSLKISRTRGSSSGTS